MKKYFKRLAAFMLALVVATSGFNVAAFADEMAQSEEAGATIEPTEDASTLSVSIRTENEEGELATEVVTAPTDVETIAPASENPTTEQEETEDSWIEETIAVDTFSNESMDTSVPLSTDNTDIGENSDANIVTYADNASFTRGDWTYNISNGRAYIAKYNGSAASVSLPTSISYQGLTYKIRSIGEFAFQDNYYLQSVTIPTTITRIERGAFQNCTNLSSVRINGNIGDCDSSSISTYGSKAYSVFYNTGTNTNGMTITFGSGVTRIPSYLFATGEPQSTDEYAHVTKVVLSASITEIGEYAFYNCHDLSAIDFSKASALVNIGKSAFELCNSLVSVNFSGANRLKTIGKSAFQSAGLRSIKFSTNLTTIENYAFRYCVGLSSIDLPQSVVALGDAAFRGCTSLSEVIIRGNIENCSSSSSNNYSSDSYSVFYNTGTNTDGMTVTFTSGVTRIPAYLFATGSSSSQDTYAHVKKVILSATVTQIGAYAFDRCYDLDTINLNRATALNTIGSYAFEYTALKSITFPDNLLEIGDGSFNYSALKTVVLPQRLTKLGDGAFRNCTRLENVTIRGDISDCRAGCTDTWYDSSYSVFYNAGTETNGIKVIFSAGVTRIPSYLFATAHGKSENVYAHVKSVFVPYTVRTIGRGAFYNCYALSELDFRGDHVDIASDAFTSVTAKAYYQNGSRSWGDRYTLNYGGRLIWGPKTAFLANVKLAGITPQLSGITIRWNCVRNAQSYFVYRRTSDGSWEYIGSSTTDRYKDTTAKRGVTYYYTVRARSGGSISPSFNSIGMKTKIN